VLWHIHEIPTNAGFSLGKKAMKEIAATYSRKLSADANYTLLYG